MPKSNATFQPEARATTTVKGYNELLAVLHIIVKTNANGEFTSEPSQILGTIAGSNPAWAGNAVLSTGHYPLLDLELRNLEVQKCSSCGHQYLLEHRVFGEGVAPGPNSNASS